jgi:hypothetical protein
MSLPNQLLVIVGATGAFFTALYTAVFVVQICLFVRSGNQSADRTDRLLDNLNWLDRIMAKNLKEAEIARQASEKQSRDALNASIQQMQLDQRAWVGPIRSILPPAGSAEYYGVVLTNTGKTPAKDVFSRISTKYLPTKSVFTPTYKAQRWPS